MASAFSTFSHNYDLILIDTGAGIAHTVISFLLGADKIILVITPDPASISDAYAVIKVVRSVNQNIPILLTANMVSSPEEGDVLYKKMNLMVQKFLKSRIIFGGSILRDEIVAKSVKGRQPFILGNPNSASAKALRILNRRMMQVPVVDRQPENNLFDRLAKSKKVDFEWKI
jgi:flagellar biosynthesis protein FlhG